MLGFNINSWIYIILSLCVSVIIGLITLLYCYFSWIENYWKKRGVDSLPWKMYFTLMRDFNKKPLNEMMRNNYEKYGRILGSFEFFTPTMAIADPDLLRDILVKDFYKFRDRRALDMTDPITRNVVSALNGEDWKRVRTIITPAFTSKRMRQMGSIINDCSKTVIEVCEKYFNENKPVDIKGMFGAFTMDVIAKAAFGTKIDSHNDPENTFVQHAKKVFEQQNILFLLMLVFFPSWLSRKLNLFSFDKEQFFQNVIRQVVKERKETGKKYNDILQILMDATEENYHLINPEAIEDEIDRFGSITDKGISSSIKYKRLSEIELVAQCLLFFVVGYETTASTLTFLAYELAMNPEWQEKLIAEVDEAFQEHSEMSYDTVREMKMLDAVISETLRMYPAALLTERIACEDYELGNTGISIEKGTRIGVPIYPMHYDPEFFENPDTFDPNRFMDSSETKHPKYTYLPFGAGPRNCLGMRFALLEIKLCIANILHHFRFRRDPSTKVPLEYKKNSGLLSVADLHLAVQKRSHKTNLEAK